MTTKDNIIEERKFDTRLIKQKMRKDQFRKEEYETYLKSLPDEEANIRYIEVYEEPRDEETPFIPEDLTFSV